MSPPLTAGEIRSALYETLVAGYTVDDDQVMQIYRVPQGLTITPCLVLGEMTADFTQAMGRGTDVYEFTIYAAVSPTIAQAWDILDALVSGNGDLSVRRVVFDGTDLGNPGRLSSALLSWDDYGGVMQVGGIDCPASRGRITVAAKGTPTDD